MQRFFFALLIDGSSNAGYKTYFVLQGDFFLWTLKGLSNFSVGHRVIWLKKKKTTERLAKIVTISRFLTRELLKTQQGL